MKIFINIIRIFGYSVSLLILSPVFSFSQVPTDYVNPFIGTANNGNTYPSAQAPFGMVSAGIQNQDYWNKPVYFPVSYAFGSKTFYGVSHTNLSGVGCPDKGSVILFPQNGKADWRAFSKGDSVANEQAQPGWYQCSLPESNIQINLYASQRSSLDVFEFGKNSNATLLLHAGRNLSRAVGGNVYKESDHALSGKIAEGQFCGRSVLRFLYYYIEFDQKPQQIIFLEKGMPRANGTHMIAGDDIGVEINFGNTRKVKAKIGLSYVSIANAKLNAQTEINGWDETALMKRTQKKWEGYLSRIEVRGNEIEDKQKFYTALYHVLLHPNIIQDVNGEYPLMGEQQGIGKTMNGENRYSTFSLWDTYRTVHPLLTLVYPEIQQQMLRTMVDMYKESGWLPKWEAGAGESYTMVGDPAAIVIADSYLKGIKNFDIQSAFKAMLKHADTSLYGNHMRPGYRSMLKYGYIPNDDKGGDYVWGSVSTSLEYYYADWCVAQLANELGKKNLFDTFNNRSQQFVQYYDKNLQLLRPRLKDGRWYEPFNPLDDSKELGWVPSGGIGFVEGHAWQYTWFVPHAMPKLVEQMGGPDPFVKQLQKCFDSSYFNLSNEPDMAYPWLFNYVPSEAWRTNREVSKCINTYFNTSPAGLPGNDDCGTLSAWLIFAMMGFYPDCPGSLNYQTNVPAFDEIIITLDKKFYPAQKINIRKVKNHSYLNGIATGPVISHQQLTGL